MDTEELSLHTPGASAVPDTKGLTALRVSLRSFRQQQKKNPKKTYNFKDSVSPCKICFYLILFHCVSAFTTKIF